MTFLHLATRTIGIAIIGALAWAPVAEAGGQGRARINPEPHSGAVLKDGSRVEFCAEGAQCKTVRHPIGVGTVRQIVSGDFVSAAPASWIALSDRSVNLCYLAASAASITCTPVPGGAELMKGTQIEYLDLDDGTRSLRFSSKSGDRAALGANYNPYPFMSGVSAAAEILQKHAARRGGDSAAYANAVGGGEVCAFIDGGGFTCTGTGGEARRAGAYDNGNRVAVAATVATPARQQADPNTIIPVDTGRSSERPTLQVCTNASVDQMNECNDPRSNMGYEAHRACAADVESRLQECRAEVRYNANLGR